MTERAYFSLKPSEAIIYQVAGSILSAFIAAGKVDDANEQLMQDKAILLAISLAEKVDRKIQSDDEVTTL